MKMINLRVIHDFLLHQCQLKLLVRSDDMMFQFLFQELKDTKAVRRYIIRKMSMEFKELLNSKAAGKIIQKISVKKTFYI
jgi:tRNA(Ser,Leu) C12 N-acetylase TAN1